MHATTSILRKKNIRRGLASNKVAFLKYNEKEEEERHLRGVRLRTQLKKEKELHKKYKKELAQNVISRRVYTALLDPANVLGLNTLAARDEVFQINLFGFFRAIAALPSNIDQQQTNALGVLNQLVSVRVPFPDIVDAPKIKDYLNAIGALNGFRDFLSPPSVSDHSDHDGDDD